MFTFEKPIPANRAILLDHFRYPDHISLNKAEKPECTVKGDYVKFNVPKTFVSKSDAKELLISQIEQMESIITDMVESGSPHVIFHAILANVKTLPDDDDDDVDDDDDDDDDDGDHSTSFETDDEQVISVKPAETTLNRHLLTWVRKTYSDNFELRAINVYQKG